MRKIFKKKNAWRLTENRAKEDNMFARFWYCYCERFRPGVNSLSGSNWPKTSFFKSLMCKSHIQISGPRSDIGRWYRILASLFFLAAVESTWMNRFPVSCFGVILSQFSQRLQLRHNLYASDQIFLYESTSVKCQSHDAEKQQTIYAWLSLSDIDSKK